MAEILVVDDEEADRLTIAAALESAGHSLHFAENSEEAVGVFLGRVIHLVVTDIVMPGEGGLSLISQLIGIKPDVPIVAVSGKSPGGLSVALAMGAETVIVKPFAPAQLVQAVDDALDGRG